MVKGQITYSQGAAIFLSISSQTFSNTIGIRESFLEAVCHACMEQRRVCMTETM